MKNKINNEELIMQLKSEMKNCKKKEFENSFFTMFPTWANKLYSQPEQN